VSLSENRTIRWWQWPTVLSLDAPAVALAWQALLCESARVSLGWAEAAVLGSSVWLAYAADRWIEGWRLDPDVVQTQRHAFYQIWRWPIASLWTVVLLSDVSISLVKLSSREIKGGLALLAAVLAYLLSHQFIHRLNRWRAPKEVCVAGLLTGGVALFIAAAPNAQLPALAAPLCLFAFLCFANCALISVWEHDVDTRHGQTSLALQYSQGARLGRAVPLVLTGIAALVYVFQPASRAVAACAFASSLLLYFVDVAEPRLGRRGARVLADFVLLTPAIPIAVRLLR
jgi:hypothetical protein